jgi:hypothetical protein
MYLSEEFLQNNILDLKYLVASGLSKALLEVTELSALLLINVAASASVKQ